MQSKVTSILKYGLGNKLFQISCAYAYSQKNNKKMIFYNDLYISSNYDTYGSYKDTIFSNLLFHQTYQTEKWSLYREPEFSYVPIPECNDNLILDGYFQSYKYFFTYLEDLKQLFNFNQLDSIKNEYKHIINKKTCSIHVRRGDYLSLPDHHPVQELDYYYNAMSLFDENTLFVVFSDDIQWCKHNLKKNVVFVENDRTEQDLYLMSLCDNHIISNSTFSWWGSIMSNNRQSKTIAPKKWFGSSYANNNTQHLYPNSWIVI